MVVAVRLRNADAEPDFAVCAAAVSPESNPRSSVGDALGSHTPEPSSDTQSTTYSHNPYDTGLEMDTPPDYRMVVAHAAAAGRARVPPPPALPASAVRAVRGVLKAQPHPYAADAAAVARERCPPPDIHTPPVAESSNLQQVAADAAAAGRRRRPQPAPLLPHPVAAAAAEAAKHRMPSSPPTFSSYPRLRRSHVDSHPFAYAAAAAARARAIRNARAHSLQTSAGSRSPPSPMVSCGSSMPALQTDGGESIPPLDDCGSTWSDAAPGQMEWQPVHVMPERDFALSTPHTQPAPPPYSNVPAWVPLPAAAVRVCGSWPSAGSLEDLEMNGPWDAAIAWQSGSVAEPWPQSCGEPLQRRASSLSDCSTERHARRHGRRRAASLSASPSPPVVLDVRSQTPHPASDVADAGTEERSASASRLSPGPLSPPPLPLPEPESPAPADAAAGLRDDEEKGRESVLALEAARRPEFRGHREAVAAAARRMLRGLPRREQSMRQVGLTLEEAERTSLADTVARVRAADQKRQRARDHREHRCTKARAHAQAAEAERRAAVADAEHQSVAALLRHFSADRQRILRPEKPRRPKPRPAPPDSDAAAAASATVAAAIAFQRAALALLRKSGKGLAPFASLEFTAAEDAAMRALRDKLRSRAGSRVDFIRGVTRQLAAVGALPQQSGGVPGCSGVLARAVVWMHRHSNAVDCINLVTCVENCRPSDGFPTLQMIAEGGAARHAVLLCRGGVSDVMAHFHSRVRAEARSGEIAGETLHDLAGDLGLCLEAELAAFPDGDDVAPLRSAVEMELHGAELLWRASGGLRLGMCPVHATPTHVVVGFGKTPPSAGRYRPVPVTAPLTAEYPSVYDGVSWAEFSQ